MNAELHANSYLNGISDSPTEQSLHTDILRRSVAPRTNPSLAENGRTAPVVEIENDLASAIGNRIKGDIHTLTAPGRAFAGFFV